MSIYHIVIAAVGKVGCRDGDIGVGIQILCRHDRRRRERDCLKGTQDEKVKREKQADPKKNQGIGKPFQLASANILENIISFSLLLAVRFHLYPESSCIIMTVFCDVPLTAERFTIHNEFYYTMGQKKVNDCLKILWYNE